MRLTNDQISKIITALDPFLEKQRSELRLYGSRVHDELKGGDIDLLLIVENADRLIENKHNLLAAIKKKIGDQKIDLVITDRNQLNQDAFLKMIYPKSILLFSNG